MSLLDYLETQTMLNEIAIERGQYLYDFAKKLEAENLRLTAELAKRKEIEEGTLKMMMEIEAESNFYRAMLEQTKP